MKRFDLRMLIVSVIVIISALSSHIVYSQAVIDTAAVDKLYAKSKAFWYVNRDSSIFYLKQVEAHSNRLKYIRGQGYANYGLGRHEPVLFKRFQYLTKALALFEEADDKMGEAVTLTVIGQIYFVLEEYEKFRAYTVRSLTIKKQVNDYGGIALCYINLGRDFQRQQLYDEALRNYKEALTYRLKEGREQGIAYAQVNLADVYLETDNYQASLSCAKKAYAGFVSSKDETGIIWSELIIGSSYRQLNKIDSAQLRLESVINNPYGRHYDHKVNLAQKDLVSIYEMQKDLKKAFTLQTQYIITRDTLDSWNKNAETQRLAKEYEFKLAEKEALQLRKQQENEVVRRNTIEYLVITVIVAMFFIILFSGRKWLKGNLIKAFAFIALLLLFESVLVITDPTVETLTQGEPLFKLLANVVLALLILPVHRLLENYTKKRLIESAPDF